MSAGAAGSLWPEGGPSEETAHRLLMSHLEELVDLFDDARVPYFLDWGALLGIYRHRNLIPWDYDVDVGLMQEDYDAVVARFAAAGGRIGRLTLEPDYYGEPRATCCILFDADPEGWIGIDLVAYRLSDHGRRALHLMSEELLARYEPSEYNFDASVLLPFSRAPLLGRGVLVPGRAHDRLVEIYGDWRTPPAGRTEDPRSAPAFRDLTRAPDGNYTYRGETAAALWVVEDAPGPLDEKSSFTELLFADDRRLWGRPQVGLVKPGERVVVPAGAQVVARPFHRTRLEGHLL